MIESMQKEIDKHFLKGIATSPVAGTACDLASPKEINRLIEHESTSLQS